MGSLFTRATAHAWAYAAAPRPGWVTAHAVTATAPPGYAVGLGPQVLPLSSGVTMFAADGAPFYNTGYLPGYPSRVLGAGVMPLRLPKRAAQLDLTDTTSWDRPVQWCGVS